MWDAQHDGQAGGNTDERPQLAGSSCAQLHTLVMNERRDAAAPRFRASAPESARTTTRRQSIVWASDEVRRAVRKEKVRGGIGSLVFREKNNVELDGEHRLRERGEPSGREKSKVELASSLFGSLLFHEAEYQSPVFR